MSHPLCVSSFQFPNHWGIRWLVVLPGRMVMIVVEGAVDTIATLRARQHHWVVVCVSEIAAALTRDGNHDIDRCNWNSPSSAPFWKPSLQLIPTLTFTL